MSEVKRFSGDEGKLSDGMWFAVTVGGLSLTSFMLGNAMAMPTTSEGLLTRECIDSEISMTLDQGEQFYIGDITTDDSFGQGRYSDRAWVKNDRGVIDWHSTQGDEGEFTDLSTELEEGFTFTENGNKYTVTFVDNPRGPVDIDMEVNCE